jgi:hypothetical protein
MGSERGVFLGVGGECEKVKTKNDLLSFSF